MWLEIIKFIIEIVKGDALNSAQEKEKLSEFLLQISDLLQETALSIESGVYPHGSCAALSSCSNSIMDILKDKIEAEKGEKLAKTLDEACIVEREWAFRDDSITIKKLLEASGEFRAAAMITKI
jgi:hypothetical protein